MAKTSKTGTGIKIGLAALLLATNVMFGFPADFLIGKINESNIVDKMYLSLKDPGVVDKKVSKLPTFVNKASAANFSMQTGYYTGTGSSGLAIDGLGFQPDTVMIKSSTTAGVMVFKTSAMGASVTAFTSATADNTATNITFTSDGFTLGTLANVNTANVLYYWVAFTGSDCSATGNYCVGSYTGNGAASRAITVGFQPSFVMVKRSTAVDGNFRTASEPANETLFFTTTARNTTGTHIASFAATTFTVGSTNNTNGGTFYYVAFKDSGGAVAQGTYTGNATDNRGITSTGFTPSMVLVKNATSATAASRSPVMNISESYGDSSNFVGAATANVTNAIQALQSDGFQVGTAAQSNGSGDTYYWAAFGGAADYSASGTFEMDAGTYTGNGTSQSVTGLDFQPDLVIIKDNAANLAVFRTALMAGNSTAHMSSATANFAGGVTSINSDGFTVGTAVQVNTSSNTYHWQAFGNASSPYKSGAADFAIGVYYGNGIDNRSITRLPFDPDMVAVKRNGASFGAWRSSALAGDLSSLFGATAEAANYIQALNGDGFQVGSIAAMNTAAALNYWFAFKTGSNFAVNSYTGTGGAQNITTPGFQPDLVWVKRSTAVNGVQRPSTLAGNNTQYFAAVANAANRVSGFVSTGFSVTSTSTETNASSGTYRYAAWRIPPPPILDFDIVDGNGDTVASPSVSLPASNFSFDCTNNAGTLGTSSQKLRVTNTTANPAWSLSIAATNGSGELWRNGGNNQQFDYNDSSGAPAGCADGGDTDSKAGQLSLDPSSATITPQSGCDTSNLTLGSAAGFAEGSVDAITLLSASSSALTGCYWDITGIDVGQQIPGAQAGDSYTIDLTLTITAF